MSDGRRTTGGQRPAALCPTCDLNDPHASALAIFLRFHDSFRNPELEITSAMISQLAALVESWLPHAKVPVVDPADIDADLAAWRAGEFD